MLWKSIDVPHRVRSQRRGLLGPRIRQDLPPPGTPGIPIRPSPDGCYRVFFGLDTLVIGKPVACGISGPATGREGNPARRDPGCAVLRPKLTC